MRRFTSPIEREAAGSILFRLTAATATAALDAVGSITNPVETLGTIIIIVIVMIVIIGKNISAAANLGESRTTAPLHNFVCVDPDVVIFNNSRG
jgi:hypothetical protein